MKDRGMKKWAPFNAVVPKSELLRKEVFLAPPSLSRDEIAEYEEILLNSLYNHSQVEITYFESNQKKVIKGSVIKIDPIKKNIHFKNKIINFRQIYSVK